MERAGKSRGAVWKAGFLFLGNHLALDFLNTRPALEGEFVELLPDFPALLHWFQAADLLSAGSAARLQRRWGGTGRARRTVEAMRKLRRRLRKAVLGWSRGRAVHPSTVDELNRLLVRHPMRTRLKASGRASSTELWFLPHRPEDLMAPLAHSAAALFATVERSRVRQCDRCVGLFLDTSKKGTRRWCSMRLCGNRQKVAAYAARQRRAGEKKRAGANPGSSLL